MLVNNSGNNFTVPDDLFDIELYNKISFIIIDALNDSFNECKKLLEEKDYNKYQNLAAVFYHHLTKILCSYLFSKYEIDLCDIKHKKELYTLMLTDKTPDLEYNGFIEYENVLDDQYLTKEYFNIYQKNNTKTLIKRIMSRAYNELKNKLVKINNPAAPRVLFTRNMSLDRKYLKTAGWNKKLFLYKEDINPIKIFIPIFEDQYDILLQSVQDTVPKLNQLWPAKFEYSQSFLQFIKKDLLTHCTSRNSTRIDADIIVSGCVSQLIARKLAATAKSLNIPVIDIWHAEETGVIDEPVFGAAEQTFCDIILGYGDFGCEQLQKGKYSNGLFESPRVVPGSSKIVNKLFIDEVIDDFPDVSNSTVMYVTTLLRGPKRYGPFMTYHDLAYVSWQKEMLRYIRDVLKPKRIIRKAHRKDKTNYTFKLHGIENIKEPDLTDLLSEVDILIYDRPTVAFVFGAATNKPIIYFDIGIRNFMPDALNSIKERCIYVKGHPKNAESLVQKAFQDRNKKCINTFTSRYSLSQDIRSREEILVDLINDFATA